MRVLVLLLVLFGIFEISAAATTSSKKITSTSSTSRKPTSTTKRTTSTSSTSRKPTSTTKRTTSTSSTSRKPTSTTKKTTSTSSTSKKPTSTTIHTSTSSSTSKKVTSTTTSSKVTTTPKSATTLTTSSKPTTPSTSTPTSKSLTSASATPTHNSGKRGLSYNDATLTQPFSLSGQGSKVSWTYNWASQPYYPGSQTSTNTYNQVLTFVPMLWSAASDLTSIWNGNVRSAITSYGADSVLAFNEPDGCCWSCGNSCMNVTEAVSAYKQWIQPFAGQVALGAPAVTNAEGDGVGLSYLSYFMGNCTGCQVDFVPLHWYGSVLDPSSFTNYVQAVYQQFGKPIWITEFAPTSGTEDQIMSFLQSVLPWLDAQTYVKRYAYFMDRAADSPYLMGSDGSNMTAIGTYYNSG